VIFNHFKTMHNTMTINTCGAVLRRTQRIGHEIGQGRTVETGGRGGSPRGRGVGEIWLGSFRAELLGNGPIGGAS
jgi:hypothetical protein